MTDADSQHGFNTSVLKAFLTDITYTVILQKTAVGCHLVVQIRSLKGKEKMIWLLTVVLCSLGKVSEDTCTSAKGK